MADTKQIDELIAENEKRKAEIDAESSALRKIKKKLEKTSEASQA